MYLYGASGHAKVIIEILTQCQIPVEGIYDDDAQKEYLLEHKVDRFIENEKTRSGEFILSIGDNRTRKTISEKLGLLYGYAIHPSSVVSISARLGMGTVLMANSVLNSSVQIGNHVIINTNATVDHDCTLDNYVHISPSACLCGGVTVREGSHVGAGAIVIPGVSVGRWCTVGAGSIVLNDLPDYSVAVGNPARVVKMDYE